MVTYVVSLPSILQSVTGATLNVVKTDIPSVGLWVNKLLVSKFHVLGLCFNQNTMPATNSLHLP